MRLQYKRAEVTTVPSCPAPRIARAMSLRAPSEGGQGVRGVRTVRGEELCHQCNFPWSLHPRRYDPEEKAMITSCSAYPVEPIRAVEACIAP